MRVCVCVCARACACVFLLSDSSFPCVVTVLHQIRSDPIFDPISLHSNTHFAYNNKQTIADGNKVNFVGFGSFVPRSRAARMGRNPKTGEEMEIKASNSVGFTAGKAFKDRLNE